VAGFAIGSPKVYPCEQVCDQLRPSDQRTHKVPTILLWIIEAAMTLNLITIVNQLLIIIITILIFKSIGYDKLVFLWLFGSNWIANTL
jgi:hypothetical protein